MKPPRMIVQIPPSVNVGRLTKALRSQGYALTPLPGGTYLLTDTTPAPNLLVTANLAELHFIEDEQNVSKLP